jgi:hypothetical protein
MRLPVLLRKHSRTAIRKPCGGGGGGGGGCVVAVWWWWIHDVVNKRNLIAKLPGFLEWELRGATEIGSEIL